MDFIKNCGSEGPSPSAQQAAEPRFFHTFSCPGLFSTASRLSHVKHVWRNPEEGSKIAPKEHPCQHATRTFRRGCKATFTGLFTQELMKTNGIYVAAADRGGSRTAGAIPAHIFGVNFAEAKTLRGATAFSYTAKGDGRLRNAS